MAVSDEVDGMSYRTLVRTGAEYRLNDEVPPWLIYRQKLNIPSHTYAAVKAADVFAVIPGFADHAKDPFSALERKGENDASADKRATGDHHRHRGQTPDRRR